MYKEGEFRNNEIMPHSEERISLRGKNKNLSRECGFLTKCYMKDLRVKLNRIDRMKTSVELKEKKFNDFKRFQYQTEFNSKITNLDTLIDNYIDKRTKSRVQEVTVRDRPFASTAFKSEYDDIDRGKVSRLLKDRIKTHLMGSFCYLPSINSKSARTPYDLTAHTTTANTKYSLYSDLGDFSYLGDGSSSSSSFAKSKSTSTINPYRYDFYRKQANVVSEDRICEDIFNKNVTLNTKIPKIII